MGISASFRSSPENVHVDFTGVAQQCRALYESIEHQTDAALGTLEMQNEMMCTLKPLFCKEIFKSDSKQIFAFQQLQRNQATFVEQMKGLKKTGESFRHAIEPLERGIYPINLKLPSDEALQEKQTVIDRLQQEIQSLKTQVQSLEKEASEKAMFQWRNDELLSQINTLQEHNTSIKRASDRHLKEKDKMAQEITSVGKANTSLQQDVAGLKEQVKHLKRQNYLLEQENESKSRKAEDLQRQLEMQKNRKITVHVQLFSPRKGDLTSMVVHEMISMLQTQFTIENKELAVSICENNSDIAVDKAVLILCINASRLGSDVASALQGLSLNKSQGLIILHHKDTHALPNQPSERLLTSSTAEYKKLGGIFDMAFLQAKGIYPCDMNNRAVDELVSFIKTCSISE